MLTHDLQSKYKNRRELDYVECRKFQTCQSWGQIQEIAHRLKGSAPSYNYWDLAEIAISIEGAIKEKNYQKVDEELGKFLTWLHQSVSTHFF